jgi:uncharacterized protein (DUF302 family)
MCGTRFRILKNPRRLLTAIDKTSKGVLVVKSSPSGITSMPTNYSVDETVDRLKSILQAKGVHLFALVDHSGEAERAGMKMPNTKLLIFGNPVAGTPVMVAAPTAALDLPLKILVAEDAEGRVSISWNDPDYLQKRHGIPSELLKNISVVEGLVAKAVS